MMISKAAKRVQEALDVLGFSSLQVVELPASTRTAYEAAQAIGCTVGQIAKSLVFKTRETNRPLLVIACGSNRVDEAMIAARVGEQIHIATADFVREHTGFVIGGVPPVGHQELLQTFIDRDLLQFNEIWAAAGTPHAVFKLSAEDLVLATGGEVIAVTESQ